MYLNAAAWEKIQKTKQINPPSLLLDENQVTSLKMINLIETIEKNIKLNYLSTSVLRKLEISFKKTGINSASIQMSFYLIRIV